MCSLFTLPIGAVLGQERASEGPIVCIFSWAEGPSEETYHINLPHHRTFLPSVTRATEEHQRLELVKTQVQLAKI